MTYYSTAWTRCSLQETGIKSWTRHSWSSWQQATSRYWGAAHVAVPHIVIPCTLRGLKLMFTMIRRGGDIQLSYLASWPLSGLGQPQINKIINSWRGETLVFCWGNKPKTTWCGKKGWCLPKRPGKMLNNDLKSFSSAHSLWPWQSKRACTSAMSWTCLSSEVTD
jgi:hypothetical protein